MGLPNTTGSAKSSLSDLQIGDFIPCDYTAASGATGSFSNLGVMKDGTSVLLHFDGSDGSTTITDSSAGAKTITRVGSGTIKTAQSKFGGSSMYFNGTTDCLQLPVHSDFAFEDMDFCIESWVYCTGSLFYITCCMDNSGMNASKSVTFYVATTGFGINLQSGSNEYRLESNATADGVVNSQWHHVACCRNKNKIYFFNNGIKKGETVIPDGLVLNTSTYPFTIGRQGSTTFGYSAGYIDEFRITKGSCVYTENFTPPTAPFSSVTTMVPVKTQIPVASSATPAGSFNFVKVAPGLAVADRVVQHSISWDTLRTGGYIEGVKNSFYTNVNPYMTGYTNPSPYEVICYPGCDGNGAAWNVFSSVNTTYGAFYNATAYFGLKLPTAKKVSKYRVMFLDGGWSSSPTGWSLSGSNDGTNWTLLHTISGLPVWKQFVWADYSFTNNNSYTYYKIHDLGYRAGATSGICSFGKVHLIDDAYPVYETLIRSLSGGTSYANDTQQYLTKLANPASLPIGAGQCVAYSPDGQYMAVGQSSAPTLNLYKRQNGTGDTYTKLSASVNSSISTIKSLCISPDEKHLSVGASSSPFLTFYEIRNDNLIEVSPPTDVPTGTVNNISYSKDGKYMCVVYSAMPGSILYSVNNGIYTKLCNPLTGANIYGCDFSPDCTQLTIVSNISPYIYTYNINTTTNVLTKITDPATLPVSYPTGCTYSPDGTHIALTTTASPYVYFYSVNKSQFVKLAQPITIPTGTGTGSPKYSVDGKYVCITHGTTPFITVYRRVGNLYSKIANPTTLPAGNATNCSFSIDNQHLAITHNTSPFITIYKTNFDLSPIWASSTTDCGFGAYPPTNEWDKYIVNSDLQGKIVPGDNAVWNWKDTNSCVKETPIAYLSINTKRVMRGCYKLNEFSHSDLSTLVDTTVGFRPVLQWKESTDTNATNLFY